MTTRQTPGRALPPLLEKEGVPSAWRILRPQGGSPTSPFYTWFLGSYLVLPRQGPQGRPQPAVPQRGALCSPSDRWAELCLRPQTGRWVFRLRPQGRVMSSSIRQGSQGRMYPPPGPRAGLPLSLDPRTWMSPSLGCRVRRFPPYAGTRAALCPSKPGPHSLTRALLKAAFFSWRLVMRPCHT